MRPRKARRPHGNLSTTQPGCAQLIESHIHLPRRLARQVYPRVSAHITLDELIALGNVGLSEAAGRYDHRRGASFSTFATYRVRGAMIDGVRRMTNLPRRAWLALTGLRTRAAQVERDAIPPSKPAPQSTSPDLQQIHTAIAAIQTVYLTSLDELRDAGRDVADAPSDVVDQLDRARLSQRLPTALSALSATERALLTKHYFEGKDLSQAGGELGRSKTWASRSHAKALHRLRTVLGMT